MIDLLNGVVVHAKKGERQHYQPIQSQLTNSSQPIDIVAALLAVYPFTQLYIADLDAIQKLDGSNANNFRLIADIQAQFPQLTLWIDAGILTHQEFEFWQQLNCRLIIGSENFKDIESYSTLTAQHKDYLLSLDFMPQGYVGPKALLTQTQYWPKDIIVMSLANVGAGLGANIALLNEIKKSADEYNFIAAGGIRHVEDLQELKSMGISAALVATALHQKQLTHADILGLMS